MHQNYPWLGDSSKTSNTKELGRRSRSARPISALVDAIRRRWAAGFALVGSERRSEGWSSRISNAEKAFYGGFCEPSAIQRVLGLEICQGGKINRAGTGFWASLKMLLRMSKSLRRHLRQISSLQEPWCNHWQARMHAWCSRRGLHTVDTLPGAGVGVGEEVVRRRCACH